MNTLAKQALDVVQVPQTDYRPSGGLSAAMAALLVLGGCAAQPVSTSNASASEIASKLSARGEVRLARTGEIPVGATWPTEFGLMFEDVCLREQGKPEMKMTNLSFRTNTRNVDIAFPSTVNCYTAGESRTRKWSVSLTYAKARAIDIGMGPSFYVTPHADFQSSEDLARAAAALKEQQARERAESDARRAQESLLAQRLAQEQEAREREYQRFREAIKVGMRVRHVPPGAYVSFSGLIVEIKDSLVLFQFDSAQEGGIRWVERKSIRPL